MAFTFGFYNSFDGDRKYDAIQMSQIFDGIIRDGVYSTVEKSMILKVNEAGNVVVQPGRAWFDHTWNYNDSDLPLQTPESDLLLDRYDAVVIDINSDVENRKNDIIWVLGTPSSNPQKPTLIKTLEHTQYPLGYVYRKANSVEILQENIENTVGTTECPFVTGILETISIDELLLQWKDQWTQFVIAYEKSAEEWQQEQRDDFNRFYLEFKIQMEDFERSYGQEFSDWFSRLQDILDENTAGHLQNEVDEITETEFNRYYGLINSTTDINKTTGVITTTTSESLITTRFQTNNNSDKTITTTISMNSGNFDYVKTTTIVKNATGTNIRTTYIRRPK